MEEPSAKAVIVSPSLVWSKNVDANMPMPEEFNRVYMHLFNEDPGHGSDRALDRGNGCAKHDTSKNVSLFQDDEDENAIDELLLLASQQYECKETTTCALTESGEQPRVPSDVRNDTSGNAFSEARFASPKSAHQVETVRKSAIPRKTRRNTEWAERTWYSWANYRAGKMSPEELKKGCKLDANFASMSIEAMNYWLSKFILEVRSSNSKEYSPDSLYQLCCGLHRSLKDNNRNEINIFADNEFAEFRGVLDGQLKTLNRTGKYIEKKRASVITIEMEERLWANGLLGDHSPKVLVNTLVYLIGLYFALRSGEEHRRLRYNPSQINVVNEEGKAPYIVYNEDISKTNQGGLKSRKLVPKRVIHHSNVQNPQRCLVRLFIKYSQLCPKNRPDGALYLTPLKSPTQNCWFSHVPIGHNKLADTVPCLMREAGIQGYFTNHSLRATATTRLYDAQVDEASIMERTGHRSLTGVRTYKRSEKLCELTSAVLNQETKIVEKEENLVKSDVKPEGIENITYPEPKCMEQLPSMPWNFGGASGFTINFNFKS